MFACVHACMCTCVHVHACVCMCVCACACVCFPSCAVHGLWTGAQEEGKYVKYTQAFVCCRIIHPVPAASCLVPIRSNNVHQSLLYLTVSLTASWTLGVTPCLPALWSLDSCLNQVQCVQNYLANGRRPSGCQVFALLWPPSSIGHVDRRSCITHPKPSLFLLCFGISLQPHQAHLPLSTHIASDGSLMVSVDHHHHQNPGVFVPTMPRCSTSQRLLPASIPQRTCLHILKSLALRRLNNDPQTHPHPDLCASITLHNKSDSAEGKLRTLRKEISPDIWVQSSQGP